ncbi:MAG: tRNA 2-thiouridine(34) synthase MnmA [Oscillospiraceae bacterium]|jgi:tRNA-specific 2-thiouridylase|nr:tRNA 2-thiouridine(34) synthase MnmA [Oscillospiraceae bacterium]
MKKVLMAMSGGVDSSVSAYILKKQGYDVIGTTLKLFDKEEDYEDNKTCCSLNDIDDARCVANKLDIPFYVFNFKDEFKKNVISKFVSSYLNGSTPNPCIDCNKFIKFDKMLRRSKELDCNFIATGHYAIIEKDDITGKYLLKKAKDINKDQSYFLYFLTQNQLEHTLFPVGNLYKQQEVRKIALENNFINSKKPDSQDICFISNGNYSNFINNYVNYDIPCGNFIDIDGNILGKHSGIINYTIGQRKGLGLSFKEPMYVGKINPKTNDVVLCQKESLYRKTFTVKDINLISVNLINEPLKVKVKTRYRQVEQPAMVSQIENDLLHVELDVPQKAITKGQALVMYDGDIVVGGGIID